MKNRAKCKLCKSIIESFHATDYVSCKCNEISICGGTSRYQVYANDFSNFIRVDDDGNEIFVMVQDAESSQENSGELVKMGKNDLIRELDFMIENIDKLPQEAMITYISYYQYYSLLLLLSALFKTDKSV